MARVDRCSDTAYRASKQANRMQTRAWAEHLAAGEALSPGRVEVTSCHPGLATSAVAKGLGMDFGDGPDAEKDGAVTPLHLALGKGIKNGAFYPTKKAGRCQFSDNAKAVQALWEILEASTQGECQ